MGSVKKSLEGAEYPAYAKIIKLEPIERGHSSRLIKLKIEGTKKTIVVGKELEIRKWLSESHLYSSAFVIDHLYIENGIPQKFILTGAGWGHGVGLCQIGAAVMGENDYSHKEILAHYFKGAELKKTISWVSDEAIIQRKKNKHMIGDESDDEAWKAERKKLMEELARQAKML